MSVILSFRVVSQQPPGGRCTLYAGYARVLAEHFRTSADIAFSTWRDAHGDGFPSLLVNGVAIQPADGVILMPADVLAGLTAHGMTEEALLGLAEALEAPLERMLEMEG